MTAITITVAATIGAICFSVMAAATVAASGAITLKTISKVLSFTVQ